MEFIVKKDDSLIKYSIFYDKDKLLELRKEIIENCSFIKHVNYTGTNFESADYDIRQSDIEEFALKYRNFDKKYIGQTKTNDELTYPSENLYEYSYDEYVYPHLVMIIDEIIKGNINYVKELFNDCKKYEKDSYENRIDKLSKQIDLIDNYNTEEKIEKLNDLKKLIEESKLNFNQKNVYEYYSKIRKEINIEYVDLYNYDEIKLAGTFLDDNFDINKYIDDNCEELLKYRKYVD